MLEKSVDLQKNHATHASHHHAVPTRCAECLTEWQCVSASLGSRVRPWPPAAGPSVSSVPTVLATAPASTTSVWTRAPECAATALPVRSSTTVRSAAVHHLYWATRSLSARTVLVSTSTDLFTVVSHWNNWLSFLNDEESKTNSFTVIIFILYTSFI